MVLLSDKVVLAANPGPFIDRVSIAAKKPDQQTVDALLKHKLVKKGKKDDETKNFFVMISLAGKKFLGTKPAEVAKA
ncbi:MAG: hypothetical protein JO114_10830 [Planctomycetaceae bacterium]|nr:hypothetical protein [Planctomycetaceae bacterium]MBV8311228.1 hypothetical protein [Planctomycetaceae bacterium]